MSNTSLMALKMRSIEELIVALQSPEAIKSGTTHVIVTADSPGPRLARAKLLLKRAASRISARGK